MRVLLLALLLVGTAQASPGLVPPEGARLPLAARLQDQHGRWQTLGAALAGHPAVVVFADWTCRALCGTSLGLARMALAEGGVPEVRLVALGLDPRDGPADALAMAGDDVLALSGDAATVAALTAAVGLHAEFDAANDQFVHPVALLVVAADGRLLRVLPGFGLAPEELSAAVRGEPDCWQRLLLMCHQALQAGPGRWALPGLSLAAAVTLLVLGGWLLRLRRHGAPR